MALMEQPFTHSQEHLEQYMVTVPVETRSLPTALPPLEPLVIGSIAIPAVWLSIFCAFFCYRYRDWFTFNPMIPLGSFLTPPSFDILMERGRQQRIKDAAKRAKKEIQKPKPEKEDVTLKDAHDRQISR